MTMSLLRLLATSILIACRAVAGYEYYEDFGMPETVYPDKRLEYHSFEPPFNEIDYAGERMLSRHWRTAGSTVVNSNFVRLTPDRQSKKGAVWSRKELDVSAFSLLFKFRISGQGKNFFGDGIGLWLVQEPYYSEGDLHGFQEKFYGVGIIFDTFKNTENLAAHRDVTILVNDGEKTYSMMTDDVQGCSMNMRYHSERADFLVTDSSRAKVEVNGTKLVVSVDAKGTGYWEECYKTDKLPLLPDWSVKAHVGVTATTGQLADNHDVISLLTYSDSALMESSEAMAAKEHKALFELNPPIDAKTITQGVYADNSAKISEYLVQIQDKINGIMNKLEFLDHHMEHEFASIDDNIDNLVGKLEKRESTSENRLENLEELVKREVEGSMNERLENIEQQLKITVERKINRLENNLDKRIETASKKEAAPKEEKKADSKTSSRSRRDSRRETLEKSSRRESDGSRGGGGGGFYKWMFWLLLIVMAGGSVFFYNFYQKNVKGFKLP